MNKEKRVGTTTVGLALIAFGILFLARIFITGLDIQTIFSFWPVILISMGTELLLYHWFSDEANLKLDTGSIILLFMLGLFTFSMGIMETFLRYTILQ